MDKVNQRDTCKHLDVKIYHICDNGPNQISYGKVMLYCTNCENEVSPIEAIMICLKEIRELKEELNRALRPGR